MLWRRSSRSATQPFRRTARGSRMSPSCSRRMRLLKITKDYAVANAGVDEDALFGTLEKLRKIISNHVGVIELAEDLDIETVTEIFIRVNSAGAALSQADLAHVEDRGERKLWRQPVAQSDRLLQPPRCGAGILRPHRKRRSCIRRHRVLREDGLAEGYLLTGRYAGKPQTLV